MLRSIVVL